MTELVADGVPARPTSRPTLRRVVVVVPAHDEEALVARCLHALDAARRAATATGLEVEIVLVLDDCTDRTAPVAEGLAIPGLRLLAVRARSVGAARAAGVRAALADVPHDLGSVWVASTDADSVVPASWILAHAQHADRGADVVVGTVRPDPADLTAAQLAAWQRTRVPGKPNGHVHGANLGVRADRYLAVSGFGAEPVHEDVDLVHRLMQDASVRTVATDEADVMTSGRLQGRAPGGYSRYLREDLLGPGPSGD